MKEPDIIICPVCKYNKTNIWATARDVEYFTTLDVYTYYKCNNCNTVFLFPVPENELKTIYPPNYYSFQPGNKNWALRIKEWLDKRLFKKILKQIKTNQLKILDVGGGTGWLCDLLKTLDNRIILTQIADIDSLAKKTAEEKGHQFFEGKIEDFNTDVQFDFILLLNLLEHVAHPDYLLQKLEKMLTPEGIILIKTPNINSIDARIFKNTYWGGLHCPRHWIIFSENSFRKTLEKSTLFIKRLWYTQGSPFWAFSIIAALTRKGILKTDKYRPVIYHPFFPFISSLFAVFDFIRRPFAKTSQMFIIVKKNISKN